MASKTDLSKENEQLKSTIRAMEETIAGLKAENKGLGAAFDAANKQLRALGKPTSPRVKPRVNRNVRQRDNRR